MRALARYCVLCILCQATVQAHGYVKVDPRWIALPTSLRSLFRQEAPAAGDCDAKTNADQGVPIPRYWVGLTVAEVPVVGVVFLQQMMSRGLCANTPVEPFVYREGC